MIRTEEEYKDLEERLQRAEGRAVIIRKPVAEQLLQAHRITSLSLASLWPIVGSGSAILIGARLIWLFWKYTN